jgi:cytochrome b6-f complex iron-sulfur subunit
VKLTKGPDAAPKTGVNTKTSRGTDKPADTDLTRRSFVKFLLGFSAVSTVVGVLIPIIGYLVPPTTGSVAGSGRVKVGTTNDIPLGQAKVVPMGNKPVLVTNTPQGIKAFSAICTHLGCIVTWDQANQLILCPCHDGKFNPTTGAVISGPPPVPLPEVPVSVDGEDIYVGGA